MTARDIIDALFRPVTAERVQKAKALADRSRIPWMSVVGLMTPEQRAACVGSGDEQGLQ